MSRTAKTTIDPTLAGLQRRFHVLERAYDDLMAGRLCWAPRCLRRSTVGATVVSLRSTVEIGLCGLHAGQLAHGLVTFPLTWRVVRTRRLGPEEILDGPAVSDRDGDRPSDRKR